MKKTIVTILLLAACLGAQAQFPHWDFILDTISYPDTSGGIQYNPKPMLLPQYSNCPAGGTLGLERLLQQFIISEPTLVEGLAGTINRDTMFNVIWRPYIGDLVDTKDWSLVGLFLYREHNGVFTVIDSIRLDTIPLPWRSFDYGMAFEETPNVIPLTESKFASDTAYLFGVKREDCPTGIDTIYIGLGPMTWIYDPHFNGVDCCYHCSMWNHIGAWEPRVEWRVHEWLNHIGEIEPTEGWEDISNWGGLFLKVRRPQEPTPGDDNFACPKPKHLRVDSYVEDCALLMWNTSEYQTLWQVALREENSSWELGSIQSFSTAGFANLCGLDVQKNYYARVRAICEHNDSVYYSAWSDSVAVRPQQAGIGSVEQNMMVTMAPNPASTSVTFNAPYGLSGVELYDLQGRKVAERWMPANANDNLGSMSMTMSLAGLPHGTYVAAIHTFGNVVTRKLVVK